jgi:hypothetical protein
VPAAPLRVVTSSFSSGGAPASQACTQTTNPETRTARKTEAHLQPMIRDMGLASFSTAQENELDALCIPGIVPDGSRGRNQNPASCRYKCWCDLSRKQMRDSGNQRSSDD